MTDRNKMTIIIRYDGDRFGTTYIHSPVGGRGRLLWRIGSAVLLFGGWLMFGRHSEWISKTRS